MIGAIARWCESLQGRSPLKIALADLMGGLGVEAVALTRIPTGRPGECASFIHDTVRGHSRVPKLTRSFAGAVMGPYLHQARPGTAWFHSLMDADPDPLLQDFQHRRHLNELAVIPLAVEPKSTMLLELHFRDHRGSGRNALITLCAPTLAETWSRRKPGLMTEILLNRRASRPGPRADARPRAVADLRRDAGRDAGPDAGPDAGLASGPDTDLLSDANPARLSRAEFRVCLLLSRGASLRGVQDRLGICESTLRTHLRSIYAKTRSENQVELLFRLLASRAADPVDRAGVA